MTHQDPRHCWDPCAVPGREQDLPGVPGREEKERRKGGPLLTTHRAGLAICGARDSFSAVLIDKQLSSMNQTLCVCSEVQVSRGNREQ